jgi:hypothetical protein
MYNCAETGSMVSSERGQRLQRGDVIPAAEVIEFLSFTRKNPVPHRSPPTKC